MLQSMSMLSPWLLLSFVASFTAAAAISRKPVCGPLAIGWYCGFSPVPSNTELYRAVTVEISTIITRYRSVTVDFNCVRHYWAVLAWLQLGYSWLRRGKKKQEKEGKPRTMPPSNGEAMARLSETSASKEPRDGATNENLVKR
ncbi:hypothetical protein BHM03_00022005 [Ensete ventricosum]|nr:hypothetical protein BHM03_00022005 [Ensete ventricosum]